ncbi:MAG: hypothetical protein IPM22_03620 [Betaproteobacteria bacterium]|nr:hypothetical protein [Betaproteobacteria bacterium]MCC7216031.1 hypothetical protein [Burkholderiales bacterium]
MSQLLEHPAVQGGVAPFVVALVVALALGRTRFAWLAIVAGWATSYALANGISFSPLTASRKILLLGLLAPAVGFVADTWFARSRPVALALAVVAGIAAPWVFLSVLSQQEGGGAWVSALGVLAFAAAMVYAVVSLRDDPVRTGAAAVGLGVGIGVAAVLSASIGFLLSGIAVAASAGALLLYWVVTSRPIAPGLLGTLTIGLLIALFAEGALMLAQMPWFALAASLLVPLAVRLPVNESASTFARAFVLSLYALAASLVPIAAAWFAARGSVS